jgi:L-amino acid N-acyltransferase YncA
VTSSAHIPGGAQKAAAGPASASEAVAAITIRDSVDDDLAAIHAIYAYHVDTGLGSFEEVPPTAAVLAERRAGWLGLGLPYIVALDGDRVCGFAYVAPYRTRSAYRFTVEDSIYVAQDTQRRGVGALLLAELIERCTALGYRQMIAVIGDSGNAASIAVHRQAGFIQAGVLKNVGLKFGRWVDTVIMQRPLGDGGDTLPKS